MHYECGSLPAKAACHDHIRKYGSHSSSSSSTARMLEQRQPVDKNCPQAVLHNHTSASIRQSPPMHRIGSLTYGRTPWPVPTRREQAASTPFSHRGYLQRDLPPRIGPPWPGRIIVNYPGINRIRHVSLIGMPRKSLSGEFGTEIGSLMIIASRNARCCVSGLFKMVPRRASFMLQISKGPVSIGTPDQWCGIVPLLALPEEL